LRKIFSECSLGNKYSSGKNVRYIYLKSVLICHKIFHCELFSWFIFLAECEILNLVDVGRRRRTALLLGWPLARYWSNGL